jgi:hypothetical protein
MRAKILISEDAQRPRTVSMEKTRKLLLLAKPDCGSRGIMPQEQGGK